MNRETILEIARGDFDEGLIAIRDSRIRAVDWRPGQIGAMRIDLQWCADGDFQRALEFLVAMGGLNYRFWELDREGGELTRYKRGDQTGARALWAAFEEHWGTGPRSFAQTLQGLGTQGVFGEIPDPQSRAAILGEVLAERRLEDICHAVCALVLDQGRVTVDHAARLADAFPLAYGDPYLKKAQLAVATFAGYLRAGGVAVDETDFLAFADYQVPRVLRALGIIEYSDSLATAIDGGFIIPPASSQERAIRAATILACERIAAHVGVPVASIDNLLWQSQDLAGQSRFHLTPTTNY